MQQRWGVLAILFCVRLSMAFQFQTVASLAPTLMDSYGVGISDIGLLISLYLSPGLFFALPGGAIGRRFGDKRIVLLGLTLMMIGGTIMAVAPTWSWQIIGRIIAGVGGVLLNVLMSKMVSDWFSGREIATAMGIFVNSWPAGIALCLIGTPFILANSSMQIALWASAAFCGLGFILLASAYKAPEPIGAVGSSYSLPEANVIKAVICAGCIWGLFNAALGMVFGFGTALLVQRGWSPAAAGSTTSLVLWGATLSVPLGGLFADRTGKPIEIMLTGFGMFAAALLIATRTEYVVMAFVGLGLVAGLSAGPIMSLPARILSPPTRAIGMGLYLTLFYVGVVSAPIIAGRLAAMTGSTQIAFDFGAFMLVLCFPAYLGYRFFADQNAMLPRVKSLA